MTNLIITVISIALVAVAALMGAYYGGQAFMEGQTNAVANTYVEQGKQIAGAWQVWSANNGGNTVLTQIDWIASGSTDLVPKYLSALPKPPYPVSSTYNQWLPIKLDSFGTTGSAPNITSNNANVNGLLTNLERSDRGNRVCNRIAVMSQGAGALPFKYNVGGNTGMPRNNALFDCCYQDSNANNNLDANETKYIVYRVF